MVVVTFVPVPRMVVRVRRVLLISAGMIVAQMVMPVVVVVIVVMIMIVLMITAMLVAAAHCR